MKRRLVLTLSTVGVLLAVSGCSASSGPAPAESTPDVELDTLTERDEGTSYDGWSQYLVAWTLNCNASTSEFMHTLTRSYGDSTRGGGACFVESSTWTACSSDSTCTSEAQAAYGSQAYGYCYGGYCYPRSGSQADACMINPNRTDGTFDKTGGGYYVVGCMTKTAGPNAACGGTNASLYMRTLSPVQWFNCG